MKRLLLVLLAGCGSPQRPPVVPAAWLEQERLERAWFIDGHQPAPGTCPQAPACADGARLVALYDAHHMPERADLVAAVLGLPRPPKVPEIQGEIPAPTLAPASVEAAPPRATWHLGPGTPRFGTLTSTGPLPTRLDLEARLASVLPGLRVLGVRPRVPGPGFVAQVEVPAGLDVQTPEVARALGVVQLEQKSPSTVPWHTAPASAGARRKSDVLQ
jgi:hypothetical protein